MAQISIDFELVTRFANLHRDVGTSLNNYRHVFRADANHIDQVVAAFRLARPAESFTATIWVADAHAAKVAETIANTSLRVLNYVRTNQAADTGFSWGAASQVAFALITAPIGLGLAARTISELLGRPSTGTHAALATTRTESSYDMLLPFSRTSSFNPLGSESKWKDVREYYMANAASDNLYQCVSWVSVRIKQLGYRGGPLVNSPTNGANMAKDLANRDGRGLDIEPKVGAVVSAPGPTQDGHVFVVEEVVRDSSGRVVKARYSEMNSKGAGAAGDYRADEWIERAQKEDTFHRVGNRENLDIYNPVYLPDAR